MSSPPNTPGKGSLRSRVGSLMRRASLIPSRPGSPSAPRRKSSSASLSRLSIKSNKSNKDKDRGSPPDAASRKSESINEEQRTEPERLTVRPTSPAPAGVPSPIVEVDTPQVESSTRPFEVPEAKDAPITEEDPQPVQMEAGPSKDESEPRVFDDDSNAPIQDEPESIKDDEVTKSEQQAPEEDVSKDAPKDVSKDAIFPEPTFTPAVMPERIIHDPANPWDREVADDLSQAPTGLQVNDPFADPPGSVSRGISTGGFSVNAGMPEPQPFQDNASTASVARAAIFAPTPQSHIPVENLEQHGDGRAPSENQPLLSVPVPQSYASTSNGDVISKSNGHIPDSQAIATTPAIKYLSAGWVPCLLPNAHTYYHHPMVRVTTDINLEDVQKLDSLTDFLARSPWTKETGPNVEIYVWFEGPEGKGTERFMKVDHHRRFATVWGGDALEEDLDKEYRYWSFLEQFPGHRVQSIAVHQDAVDLVCWAVSDALLATDTRKKSSTPSSPFSRKEAENLLALLKSFEDSARHGATPSIAHTRLVARIFLRSLDFRRTTTGRTRPFPILPTTGGRGRGKNQPLTQFFRKTLTILVSLMGLGIPILFHRRSRFDEEAAGYQDTSTPSLMLGTAVCLVAAILLSASVSFLALPGLEADSSISRIAILVAALFASFAMISTIFTIFRLKSDLETAALYLGGGEDLLMISNRSILMSLPIVFLAYSIIAFVVGLVVYTFFAGFEGSPGGGGSGGDGGIFGAYTQWVVVGVFGALGGVFFATILALGQ